jgi:hypothetical protein
VSLAEKIASDTKKKDSPLARARVSRRRVSAKTVGDVQELLRPHLPRVIKAWVDGLKATVIAYDRTQQKMVDTGLPDHKERRESGRAIIEYLIGKAIERSMQVTGSYKELSVILEELRQSPEAMRLLPPELFESIAGGGSSSKSGPENSEIIPTNSSQSTAEGSASSPVPEAKPPEDSEQKTG